MTAAMAFGHCAKLWFGEVSRHASMGPQAQSAAQASDVVTQLFARQAVHAEAAPSPSVGREPSHATAGEASDGAAAASDGAGAASDAPSDAPPDEEVHA
jgi:hypothetical protein